MRRGGQNSVVGPDPTVFPKSGVILDQLYTCGYSAVADASKFFYNFPTRKEDQPYRGCIDPSDNVTHYVYKGLPMGAGNSPAIAGRHGAALLRLLKEYCPLYQGQLTDNTWWSHYAAGSNYDPRLGHGLVYIDEDGLPAALLWAHCDDFLLHDPTYAKT
jgi:hypothetical protein